MTGFIAWLKRLLGYGDPVEPEPPPEKKAFPLKRPPLRKPPLPEQSKLPRRYTNRPGVKQSQVNLKKSGYRKDAKIEER